MSMMMVMMMIDDVDVEYNGADNEYDDVDDDEYNGADNDDEYDDCDDDNDDEYYKDVG